MGQGERGREVEREMISGCEERDEGRGCGEGMQRKGCGEILEGKGYEEDDGGWDGRKGCTKRDVGMKIRQSDVRKVMRGWDGGRDAKKGMLGRG